MADYPTCCEENLPLMFFNQGGGIFKKPLKKRKDGFYGTWKEWEVFLRQNACCENLNKKICDGILLDIAVPTSGFITFMECNFQNKFSLWEKFLTGEIAPVSPSAEGMKTYIKDCLFDYRLATNGMPFDLMDYPSQEWPSVLGYVVSGPVHAMSLTCITGLLVFGALYAGLKRSLGKARAFNCFEPDFCLMMRHKKTKKQLVLAYDEDTGKLKVSLKDKEGHVVVRQFTQGEFKEDNLKTIASLGQELKAQGPLNLASLKQIGFSPLNEVRENHPLGGLNALKRAQSAGRS